MPVSVKASDYNNISLVSVSTAYSEQSVDYIKQSFEKKGYQVSDKYLDQVVSDLGYVNTEKSRANLLIEALKDNDNDILWFVRGGGGAINLLPYLKQAIPELKNSKPKLIVGFSDVTAIHQFVNEYLDWPSLHAVVAGHNQDLKRLSAKLDLVKTNECESIPDIRKIMKTGVSYKNVLPLNQESKKGTSGESIGGNLTLVSSTFATDYQLDFKGKILFIEDVGLSYRQLDRSLHQLLYMGSLKHVNGIVFGQFYPKNPLDSERLIYKKTIENFAKQFYKPVYYFPFFGHGYINKPILLNSHYNIKCDGEEFCTLSSH
ncbi:Muramoyltetrapeptide carboxypeptidase [Photobacterium marinum]|uniref:Muramoyltetrapeptide carboxypeptidase n=2 Tax=Photobacterium marinum TaxID=1056511 RepID=L8JDF0_9GAMM|nr:Muramoyltetrapeptide carboxypeptidase [Photobacterium marinum]